MPNFIDVGMFKICPEWKWTKVSLWNWFYLIFLEDQPKEETIKTAINQDVLAKARNDSECGSLIVECGSPAKNALQLLAEIDDNQEQSSQKSALKLLDEVDQIESIQTEVVKEEEKVPEWLKNFGFKKILRRCINAIFFVIV